MVLFIAGGAGEGERKVKAMEQKEQGALVINPKGIPEGCCYVTTWIGHRLCIVRDEGKIKIFEVREEEA